MSMIVTPEARARYLANRRRKYHNDEEYRARILQENKTHRVANRDVFNARRRDQWATDPEYREKRLAPRRGRDQRSDQLKTHYGITIDDYNKLLNNQGGVCGICRTAQKETLCVDHCHSTGKVRGLLCRKCNTGLGCYGDSGDLMLIAVRYLERQYVD